VRKGSRGFEARYWQQSPFWKGGKSWADWELNGARIPAVVLVGLSCSEFGVRSIGLLISINAGIQMQHIPTESKH
jgi:hypothetical protein